MWRAVVEAPHKDIYKFEGVFEYDAVNYESRDPLNLENTLWANTVLASGNAIGLVIYTGKETRSVLNSRKASSKFGICDSELNRLAIVLFILMIILSMILLMLNGFYANSVILLFRYILLMSSIIPISLRVNLDMAKIYYCW